MKLPVIPLAAIAAMLLAGCATVTPQVTVRATANEAGRLAAPAKIYVERQTFAHHPLDVTRDFAARYGAGYQEKLDERYATLLAAGDGWAKREAAKIEAHARLAPTVAALLSAQGYTVVPKEAAEYTLVYALAETPWEQLGADAWITDNETANEVAHNRPHYLARLFVDVRRTPYTPGQLRLPYWHGELSAEDKAPPKAYLKTLLQYLGRSFTGAIPLESE